MKAIRTIIVDDEKGARESLAKMAEKYCPHIEVIAKADSMKTAYEAINELNPDLVFLDIEMPNGNAFDLLEKFKEIDFEIIFTTAYDHYAIKAIKFSAIDYILKPIDPEELVQAVNRLENKVGQKELLNKKFTALLSNLKPENKIKKVAVIEGDGIMFVNISEIIRCEAANNFALFILTDKREVVGTRSLSEYEQLLSEENFMRVHRAHLINLNHIKKFKQIKGEGGTVIMIDDSKVEVSRRSKQELLERMSSI